MRLAGCGLLGFVFTILIVSSAGAGQVNLKISEIFCNEVLNEAEIDFEESTENLLSEAEVQAKFEDLLIASRLPGIPSGQRLEILNRMVFYARGVGDHSTAFSVLDYIMSNYSNEIGHQAVHLGLIVDQSNVGLEDRYFFWDNVAPVGESGVTAVVTHPKLRQELLEHLSQKRLRETILRWNLSSLQLRFLDKDFVFVPATYEESDAATGALYTSEGLYVIVVDAADREQDSRFERDEGELLELLRQEYLSFGYTALKAAGFSHIEYVFRERMEELVDWLLKTLRYELDTTAVYESYWVQPKSVKISPAERKLVARVRSALKAAYRDRKTFNNPNFVESVHNDFLVPAGVAELLKHAKKKR